MTQTTDLEALAAKLEEKAKKEREIADNSLVVLKLLQPELDRFNAREAPWNTYAVRMAVDHMQSEKRDRAFADDLDAAATALRTIAQDAVVEEKNDH